MQHTTITAVLRNKKRVEFEVRSRTPLPPCVERKKKPVQNSSRAFLSIKVFFSGGLSIQLATIFFINDLSLGLAALLVDGVIDGIDDGVVAVKDTVDLL